MRYLDHLNNDKGASTVEFAICLPVVIFFIALLLGVTYVSGKYNLCYQVVDNVLREAITLEESEQVHEQLKQIAMQTAGNGTDVELNVEYEGKFVEVKATIQLDGSPISSLIREVSANAVGRIER